MVAGINGSHDLLTFVIGESRLRWQGCPFRIGVVQKPGAYFNLSNSHVGSICVLADSMNQLIQLYN